MRNGVSRLLASVGLATLVAGTAPSASSNAGTIELTPDIRHIPALAEVAKDVGVRYPAGFREYLQPAPARTREQTAFAVGAASMRVFDDAFGKVFRRAVPVTTDEEASDRSLDAVIVPEIRNVSVSTAPPLAGRWWFVWGTITYRFVITSTGSDPPASWEVTGRAEQLADARTETFAAVSARVLTHCIEDAGVRFMRSFYDVPEAERWSRNLGSAQASAPPQAQVTEPAGDAEAPEIVGQYPGVAKVGIRPLAGSNVVLRVTVENQSANRLLVRPSGMALELSGNKQLAPVPVYAYVASQLPHESTVSGQPVYIPPPPVSLQPSYFAVYNLIYALELLASMEAEKKTRQAFDAQLEKFRGNEFREQRVAAGGVATGEVHFIVPTDAGPTGEMHFVMPIVDLDTATRYVMRLSVQVKKGESQ